MKEWAKVVETQGQQVLFYHEYDSDEDEYVIHQIVKRSKDDLKADIKLIRKSDAFTQENFLKAATVEQADKLIKMIENI